jgi:MFS family permease
MHSRWLILAILFFARTALAFQFQSIAAVSQFLVTELALDFAQLGLLVGVYMLPGVVISVPGGMLGARFGDKSIVLCGLLLMVIGGALTALADQYGMALTGRVIAGVGAVLLNVLLTKMTSDWFAGREIVVAMAILVTSWPLGIGVALAVEPFLAAAHSTSLAMNTTAAVAAIAFVLVALFYRTPAPGPTVVAGRLLRAFTARELFGASVAGIVWAIFNVSYILLVTFSPPLLVARGLSAADAGFATSLATWTLIVSVPLGGVMIERTGRPLALIAASVVLMACAITLVAYSHTPRLTIALAGFIAGIPAGAIMAMPAGVLKPENRAAGMGVFFAWYYLAMALFPALAGLLRDISGDARLPLVFASSLCIVTLTALLAFAILTRASASPEAAR